MSSRCREAACGAPEIGTDKQESHKTGPHAGNLLADEFRLLGSAIEILDRRRQRARIFGPDIFGEPAWEMLLELYVRESSGASSTTTQLALGLDVPFATAVTWLQVLDQKGFVALAEHPLPGKPPFVELTERAREALERYLAAIGNQTHGKTCRSR